jgi:hypothetical protein
MGERGLLVLELAVVDVESLGGQVVTCEFGRTGVGGQVRNTTFENGAN